jgi:FkbM family methyltransferase
MKKIGKWFVPDEENFSETISAVKSENWSCKRPLEISFKYVKRFHKAIDVGTWIGDSTKIIQQRFYKTIGFEANNEVFNCCKRNLINFKNITLNEIALSNNNKDKIFFNGVSTFSGWVNTLSEEKVNEWGLYHVVKNKGKVKCRSLDSFNFRGVDLLKLDADSHEGYIIQGGRKFFQRNNPVILLEYKPKVLRRQNEIMPDPMEQLEKIGYTIIEKVGSIDYILTRNL